MPWWVFFSLCFLFSVKVSASPPIIVHMEGDILQMAEEHARIASQNAGALDKFHSLDKRSINNKQNIFTNALQKRFLKMHLPFEYEKSFSFFDFIWGWGKNQYLNYLSSEERTLLSQNWDKLFWNTSVIWKFDNASVFHGTMLESNLGSFWNKTLAILHAIPNSGFAYVGISSLGFHHFGFSGFNESGLSLSTHSFPTSESTSRGTLSSIVASEVLRNARSLADAIHIISSFPRVSGTSYVLSQGIDRATVESNAYEISVRKATGPYFYQTDLPETPSFLTSNTIPALDLQKEKLEKYKSLSNRNILGSPKELFKILDEVSSPATVLESVLDPHQKKIFIKPNPYSSDFFEIRFQDLRSREKPKIESKSISELDSLHPATSTESLHVKIHRMMLEDNPSVLKNITLLGQTLIAQKTKPIESLKLFFWGALFFDPDRTLQSLSLKLVIESLHSFEKEELSLWIALLMDHQKQRPLALRFYAKHYNAALGYTRSLAQLGLRRVVHSLDLSPDWVHLDLISRRHFVTDFFAYGL